MRYLYRRGQGAKRRVVHLAAFNYLGELTMEPICGRANGQRFDTTSNVPWGQPLCKRCRAVLSAGRERVPA